MIEDAELLRRYAESRSEEAFAELVRRRIGLVYSVALRRTGGDAHRAQDATQAVFTDLARKAAVLAQRPVLAGWLCRSAQFAASDLMRAAQRRAHCEQEAHLMPELTRPENTGRDWEAIRPALDEVLNAMDERDRDAIALRFFDGRPFAEIGTRLRLSENAARMRVERALEKVRVSLARQGVTSTQAALATALAQQAAATVPAGFATSVTGAALAASAAGSGVAGAVVAFMSMNKLPLGIAGALSVAGLTVGSMQAQATAALHAEVTALRAQTQAIAAVRAENLALARTAGEVAQLRGDAAELPRVRAEAAVYRKRAAAVARQEPVRIIPPPPFKDTSGEMVTMRLQSADLSTVLSAYQIYSGQRVVRHTSLTGGYRFDLMLEKPVPKEQAIKAILSVLALNGIAIVAGDDGSVVAMAGRKP